MYIICNIYHLFLTEWLFVSAPPTRDSVFPRSFSIHTVSQIFGFCAVKCRQISLEKLFSASSWFSFECTWIRNHVNNNIIEFNITIKNFVIIDKTNNDAYPVDHYRRDKFEWRLEGFRFIAVLREQIIREWAADTVVDRFSCFLAQTDVFSALKFDHLYLICFTRLY